MNDEQFDLRIKINRARINFMFMIIMSIMNVFLISTGSATRLPYASAISRLAIEFAAQASAVNGSDAVRILGLIAGCSILLLLTICYFMSKTKPRFFVIALALIVADTFALVVFSLATGTISDLYVILDIFIHLLSVLYTYRAIQASVEMIKLKNQSQYNQQSVTEKALEPEAYQFADTDDYYDETSDVADEPIGKYIDDGTPALVSGSYNGLDAFAVIRDGKAELVINDYVCDELDVTYYDEFTLRAFVNDIDFTFEYKKSLSGEAMYLYADDTLLDSLGKS